MKTIKLTQRAALSKILYTLVDDEDYNYLIKFSWYSVFRPNTIHVATQQIELNKTIYIHQILLPAHDLKLTPDHKDGNGLNNQKDNLRLATKSQQAANTQKRNILGSSNYKGVCFSKQENKWKAYIDSYGRKHLGTFNLEIDAAKAYNKAAQKFFGEFAVLNNI